MYMHVCVYAMYFRLYKCLLILIMSFCLYVLCVERMRVCVNSISRTYTNSQCAWRLWKRVMKALSWFFIFFWKICLTFQPYGTSSIIFHMLAKAVSLVQFSLSSENPRTSMKSLYLCCMNVGLHMYVHIIYVQETWYIERQSFDNIVLREDVQLVFY